MAELAEGARLLSEYGAKVPSRVRIPLSPPDIRKSEINLGLFIRTHPQNASNAQYSAGGGLPTSSKCSQTIVYAGNNDFFACPAIARRSTKGDGGSAAALMHTLIYEE